MQCEVLNHRAEDRNSKELRERCVKRLLRAGMVPVRTWGAHAVGMSLTERLQLTRQMTAPAGTTSLSLFMETYGLEVEEELSTMAIQYWAEGVWIGKCRHEQKEALRGPAGAAMCETRDLGMKWPYWHTLIFGNDIKIDMRFVCPKDVKKMLVFSVLEKMGSQARV